MSSRNVRALALLTLATAAGLGGCAALSDRPAAFREGTLTTHDGQTLYIYRKDSPSTSHCYDHCAHRWLPFSAKTGGPAGSDFGTIWRAEGIWQWTYKGQPLYTRNRNRNRVASQDEGAGDSDLWSPVRAVR